LASLALAGRFTRDEFTTPRGGEISDGQFFAALALPSALNFRHPVSGRLERDLRGEMPMRAAGARSKAPAALLLFNTNAAHVEHFQKLMPMCSVIFARCFCRLRSGCGNPTLRL